MRTNFLHQLTPLWIGVLAYLVISCGKNTSTSGIEKVLVNQTPETLTLAPDTLPIDLLYPTDLVCIDTFLLVSQHHEKDIIRVYSTRTFEFLGSFLRKGGGPNEVQTFGLINQWFVEDGSPKVVIQSYPNYLGVLNIPRSLSEGTAVFDRKYGFESDNARKMFMSSHSVYLLNPTQLLMTKDPLRSGIKEHNNFFFDFYDYEADKLFRPGISYEDFPLIDSFLKESARALKPDKTKMALFYIYFDRIGIVDLQTGHVKQVVADLGKDPVSTVVDVDTRRVYYDTGKCTDKYLFGLYEDGVSVSESESPESPWTSILRVFDWDGMLQYEANLSTKIRLMAVDGGQDFLYGVTADDVIVRYDLSFLPE